MSYLYQEKMFGFEGSQSILCLIRWHIMSIKDDPPLGSDDFAGRYLRGLGRTER